MPKLDKRYTLHVVECKPFYLYRKHKNSCIYYAYFVDYRCSRSTSCTNIQDAYRKAWDMLSKMGHTITTYYNIPEDKKRLRDLNYILRIIPQDKPLTIQSIKDIQKLLQVRGCTNKTINNYISILKRYYTEEFPPYEILKINSVYRHCLPIESHYGLYSKLTDRLHYLYYFAVVSGCRLGELRTVEFVMKNGREYIKINGTKTANAVRLVPCIPEAKIAYEKAEIDKGFRSSAYKESVVAVGELLGYTNAYIEENHITFHTTRKVLKTLLASITPAISNNYVEMILGHSQTRTVNDLYFDGSSMDDSAIYVQVIEALRRLI